MYFVQSNLLNLIIMASVKPLFKYNFYSVSVVMPLAILYFLKSDQLAKKKKKPALLLSLGKIRISSLFPSSMAAEFLSSISPNLSFQHISENTF